MQHDQAGDGSAGAWRRESLAVKVVFLLIAANLGVEAGQTQRGAANIERGDRPEDLRVGVVGGAKNGVAVGGAVVMAHQPKRHERRGDAEGDDIGKAVELRAEVGGRAGEPRNAAIDGVEEHAEEDKRAREGKRREAEGAVLDGLGGVVDRGESADHIAQGEQRGQHAGGTAAAAARGRLKGIAGEGRHDGLARLRGRQHIRERGGHDEDGCATSDRLLGQHQ